ncbi:MAG: Mth938-like domain-containing protein [Alphaproteobacteria bacterium]|nr:Mth938-like domain-containing protein [Alphaproteobacteria bacterium]
MTDVTPLIPAGRQVVDSYGRKGFHVSGVAYEGAIVVTADATVAWRVTSLADVTVESLSLLFDRDIEILLLGCGARLMPVPGELRVALRQKGIVVDAMDTGAACRTYNVLLAEERRVAAALLPAG